MKFSGSAQAGTVMYADRATAVVGKVTCTYDTAADTQTAADNLTLTFNVDLDLKRGWNSVVLSGRGQGQAQPQGDADIFSGSATLNLVSQQLPGTWLMPVQAECGAVPLGLSQRASGLESACLWA